MSSANTELLPDNKFTTSSGSNKCKETIKERGQIRFRRIGFLSSNTPEKNKDTSIASY
ncbi:hypothetical protein [Gemella taiwanensis]